MITYFSVFGSYAMTIASTFFTLWDQLDLYCTLVVWLVLF